MLTRLLKSFDFDGPGSLLDSLLPGLKHHISGYIAMFSYLFAFVEYLLGLNGASTVLFVLVMVAEVVTGLKATKEPISSLKFGRFTLKMVNYLLIIALTYQLHLNYEKRGWELASGAFQWLNIYLVLHIAFENVISVMENLAVMHGKPKSHYVGKIKDKLNNLF